MESDVQYFEFEFSNHPRHKEILKRFYTDIEDPEKSGAILIGVCRGRLSEGLDFKDRKARCVIVVGIPLPNIQDPKIILKKHYLEEKRKTQGRYYTSLNGKQIKNISGW